MREWFVTNIQHVCLQMFNSKENIVIFCHSGRSRSPMYLVAYLVLFCNESLDTAMKLVEQLMQRDRHRQLLDRHCTLHEIVATIEEIVIFKLIQ